MNHSTKSENLCMLMSFMGNAIFGFSFLFSKLALDVADPLVLIFVRFVTAFLVMTVLVAAGLIHIDLKGKDIKPLLLLGLYQPVCYFICETYGIKFTSSSFSGVMIALIPIAGLVLCRVILKEKPTTRQKVFSLLSVAGVIVLTTTGGIGSFEWKGFFLLLGAVVSGAMFSIQSRSTADKFTAIERTYVMFGLGALVFTILALLRVRTNISMLTVPLTTGGFWISILYLSCASSIGAFLMLNKALDVLPVTRNLVFANVTAVISVLAGVMILHEHFSFTQAIGIVMALIGVYGVNKYTA